MNYFFLFFFSILGIAGLVFKVDAGVFAGLGLAPWQVIRLNKGEKINLLAIVITAVAGSIYFIFTTKWLFLFLFLFIQLYNYWGHLRAVKRKDT